MIRPHFVRNLLVSVDYYDIRIKNAINTASAEDVAKLCVDQPTLDNPFCALFTRSATTGFVNGFSLTPKNVAGISTNGFDLALDWTYTPSASIGQLNLHLVGNYLRSLKRVASPGAEVENQTEYDVTATGGAAPKYSGSATLNWRKGAFSLTYDVQYWSKTLRFTREQLAGQPDIVAPQYIRYKERWLHGAQASLDIAKRFNLYVGVENLFDTKPDVGAVAYPVPAVGRSFYAGFRASLGGKGL